MRSALIVLVAFAFMGFAQAEQTTGEKASASAHDMKRAAKKDWHRMEESVCAEGDAKCAAKKAKHRVHEGTDYMKDKSKEVGDKVD